MFLFLCIAHNLAWSNVIFANSNVLDWPKCDPNPEVTHSYDTVLPLGFVVLGWSFTE